MKSQVNIYDFLDHLEKWKGMYLGPHHNFKSLDSFITGFTVAASAKQLEHEKYPGFHLFNIWLLGHLERNFGLSAGWYWQIRNRNPKNDEKAFKEFFAFLHNFKKAKLKKKELILDKESIAFHSAKSKRFRVVKGKETRIRAKPASITWTSFSNSTTVMVDYLDKNGKNIESFWEINAQKTTIRLQSDFGKIENNWKKLA